ncbi:hypothetical protein AB0M28_30610 [Streptomyces sp. NPDC051940]|uniref:hypothetical protein n=1 Tax=Streptomyces sp. NPDC051940 TaxID=3155675 RepID=UPI00343389F1
MTQSAEPKPGPTEATPAVPAAPATPPPPAPALTQPGVPAQAGGAGPGRPQSFSEATRLLCAGVYLHAGYRRRVIEELVEQRQRTVAPSLGVDAVPVLAHALRVRRREVYTGLWLAVVWLVFFIVEFQNSELPYAAPAYAGICAMLWLSRVISGRSAAVYTIDGRGPGRAARWRDWAAFVIRWYARLLMLVFWLAALYLAPRGGYTMVFFPLLLVLPVWAHRVWVDRVLRDELSRPGFRNRPRLELPAEQGRLSSSIDQEQYARLTVYDPYEPFVGYGRPYEPWSFAVELKQRKTLGGAETPVLTSRQVIDLVLPKLGALRQSAAATSRDRLRQLEVDHLAYLPTSPKRGTAGYDEPNTDRHISEAVDEGAEARRYFLRVRVGAWDELVVVSVLVRVHTQGGMLVLEVVPHVLYPIRADFREVDRLAARGASVGLRSFVRALTSSPTAVFASAVSIARTVASALRSWLHDPEVLPGEGPVASVRELGSADEVSLFQEMDISRYVKTVQDRITSGVTDALEASGFETDRFTQQVVNISEGGMFIGSMSGGAVAQGSGARAASGDGGEK